MDAEGSGRRAPRSWLLETTEGKAVERTLKMAVSLCARNSSLNSQAASHRRLWFMLLDQLVSTLRSLRREATASMAASPRAGRRKGSGAAATAAVEEDAVDSAAAAAASAAEAVRSAMIDYTQMVLQHMKEHVSLHAIMDQITSK